MLFVPQLRRQGSLLYFTPSATRVYRIGNNVLIVQNSQSFVSSYVIDLTGREAEQFHVKYIPSTHFRDDDERTSTRDIVCDAKNAPSPAGNAQGGIVHVCLYKVSAQADDECLGGHRLAVLLRDRLITLDLTLQQMDSFQLESVPALSILPGNGYLMIVDSKCFTVFNAKDRTFVAYYLTATSVSTSKPLVSLGSRVKVLSHSLCGAIPICIVKCGDLLRILSGDRIVKSFRTASRPGDRYTVCSGRVFRIRKQLIEVYGIGNNLVLEGTIKDQEGSGTCFVDVFPSYGGCAIVKLHSKSVSHYLHENGMRLDVPCEIVADLPFFSMLERDGKVLLKTSEREDIENPEDMSELSSYLLLSNPLDDRLFHRSVMFVLFKRFMKGEYASSGSELCKELSCFTVGILSIFDCVNLIGSDLEKYFKKLMGEKTLIDCLVLDFRIVNYPFVKYKEVYDLLLAVNTRDSISESHKCVALPDGMLDAVLKTAMKRGKHGILLDLVDEACNVDHSIVDFLMSTPAACYHNKEKLVRVLTGRSLQAHCIGRVINYLHGLYHLIRPESLKDNSEFQYRLYRRILDGITALPDAGALDTAPMHLLFDLGRGDLGCILGYSLYFHSQGVLRDEVRQEVLKRVRENIKDYVFVFDGRFVGHETLCETSEESPCWSTPDGKHLGLGHYQV